jgi:hypothetical protein
VLVCTASYQACRLVAAPLAILLPPLAILPHPVLPHPAPSNLAIAPPTAPPSAPPTAPPSAPPSRYTCVLALPLTYSPFGQIVLRTSGNSQEYGVPGSWMTSAPGMSSGLKSAHGVTLCSSGFLYFS